MEISGRELDHLLHVDERLDEVARRVRRDVEVVVVRLVRLRHEGVRRLDLYVLVTVDHHRDCAVAVRDVEVEGGVAFQAFDESVVLDEALVGVVT